MIASHFKNSRTNDVQGREVNSRPPSALTDIGGEIEICFNLSLSMESAKTKMNRGNREYRTIRASIPGMIYLTPVFRVGSDAFA